MGFAVVSSEELVDDAAILINIRDHGKTFDNIQTCLDLPSGFSEYIPGDILNEPDSTHRVLNAVRMRD
jgi:hypothetical protein